MGLTWLWCFFNLVIHFVNWSYQLMLDSQYPLLVRSMSSGFLAFMAFAPILLAGVVLIGLRWPARRAMPLVYLLSAGIALFGWDMSFNRVLASTLQGLVVTVG